MFSAGRPGCTLRPVRVQIPALPLAEIVPVVGVANRPHWPDRRGLAVVRTGWVADLVPPVVPLHLGSRPREIERSELSEPPLSCIRSVVALVCDGRLVLPRVRCEILVQDVAPGAGALGECRVADRLRLLRVQARACGRPERVSLATPAAVLARPVVLADPLLEDRQLRDRARRRGRTRSWSLSHPPRCAAADPRPPSAQAWSARVSTPRARPRRAGPRAGRSRAPQGPGSRSTPTSLSAAGRRPRS